MRPKLLLSFIVPGSILLISTIVLVVTLNDEVSAITTLKGSAIPDHYDLHLKLDPSKSDFNGDVKINFSIAKATNNVTLNAKNLKIHKVDVSDNGGTAVNGVTVSLDRDFLIIDFQKALGVREKYTVTVDFSGNTDGNQGLLRGHYWDDRKKKFFMIPTFSPNNARQVFPCFDDPGLKATFRLSLTTPIKYKTSSNVAIDKYHNGENNIYQTTKRMPIHLLNFLISEFHEETSQGILVRSRPEAFNLTLFEYALNVTSKALKTVEDYLEMPLPSSKLQLVAIPDDQLVDDRATWGLIFLKESHLLININTTTTMEKVELTTNLLNMILKQWIGSVVTPFWWDDSWMVEGLAMYLAHNITGVIQPTWNMSSLEYPILVQPILQLESSKESKPAEFPVVDGNIEAIFEEQIIKKGALIAKMIHKILGDEIFRNGLKSFLKYYEDSTATSDDLLRFFEMAIDQSEISGYPYDFTALVNDWLKNPGFPLINIFREYIPNENGRFPLTYNQDQFFLTTNFSSKREKWIVPINYLRESTANFDDTKVEMILNEQHLASETPTTVEEWLILNPQHMGFYRVNYDKTNWQLLTNTLMRNFSEISPINRAALVDDSFNLARAGSIPYHIPLDLVKYLKGETQYAPVAAFTEALKYLDDILIGTEHHDNMKKFAWELLYPIYERVSFKIKPEDDHNTRLLRTAILPWICKFGSDWREDCLREARLDFLDWIEGKVQGYSIKPDLQSVVYCYGKHDPEVLNEMTKWKNTYVRYTYLKKSDAELRRLIGGLGCSNVDLVLFDFLKELVINRFEIKEEHRLIGFKSIYSNNGLRGVEATLRFLTEYLLEATDKFGLDAIEDIIQDLGAKVISEWHLEQLYTLINKYDVNQENASVRKAFEMAQYNIAWLGKRLPEFEDYFSEVETEAPYHK